MRELSKDSIESQYNDEPVYYCKNCLSLYIVSLDAFNPDEGCYCENCSKTDIGITDIFSYRELYFNKYHKYPEE